MESIWMMEHEYESISQMKGSMSQQVLPNQPRLNGRIILRF